MTVGLLFLSPPVYKNSAIIGEIEGDWFWNAHFRELTDVSPLGDVTTSACIRHGDIPGNKKAFEIALECLKNPNGRKLSWFQLLNCNPGSVSSCKKSVMSMAKRLSFL